MNVTKFCLNPMEKKRGGLGKLLGLQECERRGGKTHQGMEISGDGFKGVGGGGAEQNPPEGVPIKRKNQKTPSQKKKNPKTLPPIDSRGDR